MNMTEYERAKEDAENKLEYGDYYQKIVGIYTARRELIKKFSWAIPNREALLQLRTLGPILEIGAGSGYWAHELKRVSGEIKATDANPESPDWEKRWTEVEKLTALEAVEKYPGYSTLLTVWPAYKEPWSHGALQAFRGDRLAYVGEGKMGCTADAGFHQELEEHWDLESYVIIPTWNSIHDYLQIYRRK